MSGQPAFEDILYEHRGRAAWIIINRPKIYNAFRGHTVEEMIRAFQLAADDKGISCVVLTGAGEKAFCTGWRSIGARRPIRRPRHHGPANR